jgi:hypothetical protein
MNIKKVGVNLKKSVDKSCRIAYNTCIENEKGTEECTTNVKLLKKSLLS